MRPTVGVCSMPGILLADCDTHSFLAARRGLVGPTRTAAHRSSAEGAVLATFSIRTSRAASRRPSVVVMQAIEDWECHDTTVCLGRSRHRLFLPQALMWPSLVVEANVVRDEAQKMALAKHEDMVEQIHGGECRQNARRRRSCSGSGPRCERLWCRWLQNRRANRAPSLASRSTTSTSGWMPSVVLRACCAHQSSDGARVTAACTILRLFRSRKNRTKIGRKSTSKVCTKSQAQVTWLRRKVAQRWPSPGTCFFMYRCTVRFETRIPSLSSSPRSRSAPHLGFRAVISRISVA